MNSRNGPATLEAMILDNLRTRKWRAGDRLPTERYFSDESGMSRSTVRRVLASLKERGLITQTVGSGTYVSDGVADALGQLAAERVSLGTSPAELMAARLVLEPAIIDMVVANANSADFQHMEQCCDNAEAARTLEDFEQWDSRLHEVIAQSAHNAVIVSVFQLINQARQEAEWGMLKRRSATPERRLDYQREHRALVDALKSRDADLARQLCAGHLLHVRANMLGY